MLCAAHLELRPDSVRAVATDGHRLVKVDRPAKCSGEAEFLMGAGSLRLAYKDPAFKPAPVKVKDGEYKSGPRKGQPKFRSVSKAPAASILWAESQGVGYPGRTAIRSTRGVEYLEMVPEGEFPDYARVIKSDKAPCVIDTAASDLVETVESVASVGRGNAIRIDLAGEYPELEASDPRGVSTKATLNGATRKVGALSGKVSHFGINPAYLSELAKPFRGQELRLMLWDENSQFQIECLDDPSYRGVIMPVRL